LHEDLEVDVASPRGVELGHGGLGRVDLGLDR
jgi:hypothetical protein